MRACEDIREELKSCVDGELSLLTRWRIGRHLATCANCREEAADIERLSQQLRSLPQALPSPRLRARILAEVAQLPAPQPIRPSASPWWLRHRRSLVWAGGAAFALTIGMVYLRQPPPSARLSESALESGRAEQAVGDAAPAASAPFSAPVAPKGRSEEARSTAGTAAAPEANTSTRSLPPPFRDGASRPSAPPTEGLRRRSLASSKTVQTTAPTAAGVAPGQRETPLRREGAGPLVEERKPALPVEKGVADAAGSPDATLRLEAERRAVVGGGAVGTEVGKPGASGSLAAPLSRGQSGKEYTPPGTPLEQARANSLLFFVDNVESRKAEVLGSLKAVGGEVLNATSAQADGEKTVTLNLLVPEEQVEAFKIQLLKVGVPSPETNQFAIQGAFKRGEGKTRAALPEQRGGGGVGAEKQESGGLGGLGGGRAQEREKIVDKADTFQRAKPELPNVQTKAKSDTQASLRQQADLRKQAGGQRLEKAGSQARGSGVPKTQQNLFYGPPAPVRGKGPTPITVELRERPR